MWYIIPNFYGLHYGENLMKTQTKIAKLQMHENLHKMWMKTKCEENFYTNFHFLRRAIKVLNKCLTLLISYMHFIPFKMAVKFLKPASNFPNVDDPNAFPKYNKPLIPT